MLSSEQPRDTHDRANNPSSPGPGAPATNEPGQGTNETRPQIRIGKSPVVGELEGRTIMVELFTMALGEEAIYLAPLKTWSQLDVFKWRVQGKLPGTPPGLEITATQVKVAGESVTTNDPEGCGKLETILNTWLATERQALEAARQKAQAAAARQDLGLPEDEPLQFQAGLDKTGQPRIRCLEGKEVVADVACTVPGLTSLINQGLLRRPAAWKIGALRDWLELDGEVFRLKDNATGCSQLERALNERYHPAADTGPVQDVRVYANPASTSGFDIEFTAAETGLAENRRRHLDPAAMDVLSDPRFCRVLRKGIVVKLTPPDLVFKQKTPEGGERELDAIPENLVAVAGEGGQTKWIDLSQPVSHLGLGAAELTAIFNHPALNRRARRNAQAGGLAQAA
jgi:hypothetical protein